MWPATGLTTLKFGDRTTLNLPSSPNWPKLSMMGSICNRVQYSSNDGKDDSWAAILVADCRIVPKGSVGLCPIGRSYTGAAELELAQWDLMRADEGLMKGGHQVGLSKLTRNWHTSLGTNNLFRMHKVLANHNLRTCARSRLQTRSLAGQFAC